MPIYASKPKMEYEKPPEGLHQGVCIDVVDRGKMVNTFGKTQEKVDLIWEVLPTDDTGAVQYETSGRRFQAMKRYTTSLHPKSILSQHLRSWRGKPFTAVELERFDLETLIGVNCQLQIAHNLADNGQTYANVQAIVPLGRMMPRQVPSTDYIRHKDREAGNGGYTDKDGDAAEDLPF